MATTNTTHVNFVKVASMSSFNDIITKVDGTIYFIVDAKKIYLDGVMYGFNDSDIDLTPFLKRDGTSPMTGDLEMGNHDIHVKTLNGVDYIYGGDPATYIKLDSNNESIDFYVNSGTDGLHLGPDIVEIYGKRLAGLTDVSRADFESTYANSFGINARTFKREVFDREGQQGGLATLDGTGKVPSSQLPSFVDDVLEYSDKASFPATGETGKLYIDLSNNNVWRWSGSAYVNVSDGNAHLQLGTTSSTAYRGDHGLIAYNHRTATNNPHAVTASQVGLGKVENLELATKAEAELGASNAKYMTPQRTKEAIEKLAPRLTWEVVS